jgi:hypothetical protein
MITQFPARRAKECRRCGIIKFPHLRSRGEDRSESHLRDLAEEAATSNLHLARQESILICPICQKRKAKRFCPAKTETICSVCCGTEREVTIDCPVDCPYLVASRQYDRERKEFDWSKLPFSDVRIHPRFARDHGPLLTGINYAICAFAREHHEAVDEDIIGALQALAESYRTLSSGIYYEKPPDYHLQLEFYNALKAALHDFKEAESQQVGLGVTRDSDIRDALIFMTQLGAQQQNGRPKSRAFLDLLRSQLPPGELARSESKIVLP